MGQFPVKSSPSNAKPSDPYQLDSQMVSAPIPKDPTPSLLVQFRSSYTTDKSNSLDERLARMENPLQTKGPLWWWIHQQVPQDGTQMGMAGTAALRLIKDVATEPSPPSPKGLVTVGLVLGAAALIELTKATATRSATPALPGHPPKSTPSIKKAISDDDDLSLLPDELRPIVQRFFLTYDPAALLDYLARHATTEERDTFELWLRLYGEDLGFDDALQAVLLAAYDKAHPGKPASRPQTDRLAIQASAHTGTTQVSGPFISLLDDHINMLEAYQRQLEVVKSKTGEEAARNNAALIADKRALRETVIQLMLDCRALQTTEQILSTAEAIETAHQLRQQILALDASIPANHDLMKKSLRNQFQGEMAWIDRRLAILSGSPLPDVTGPDERVQELEARLEAIKTNKHDSPNVQLSLLDTLATDIREMQTQHASNQIIAGRLQSLNYQARNLRGALTKLKFLTERFVTLSNQSDNTPEERLRLWSLFQEKVDHLIESDSTESKRSQFSELSRFAGNYIDAAFAEKILADHERTFAKLTQSPLTPTTLIALEKLATRVSDFSRFQSGSSLNSRFTTLYRQVLTYISRTRKKLPSLPRDPNIQQRTAAHKPKILISSGRPTRRQKRTQPLPTLETLRNELNRIKTKNYQDTGKRITYLQRYLAQVHRFSATQRDPLVQQQLAALTQEALILIKVTQVIMEFRVLERTFQGMDSRSFSSTGHHIRDLKNIQSRATRFSGEHTAIISRRPHLAQRLSKLTDSIANRIRSLTEAELLQKLLLRFKAIRDFKRHPNVKYTAIIALRSQADQLSEIYLTPAERDQLDKLHQQIRQSEATLVLEIKLEEFNERLQHIKTTHYEVLNRQIKALQTFEAEAKIFASAVSHPEVSQRLRVLIAKAERYRENASLTHALDELRKEYAATRNKYTKVMEEFQVLVPLHARALALQSRSTALNPQLEELHGTIRNRIDYLINQRIIAFQAQLDVLQDLSSPETSTPRKKRCNSFNQTIRQFLEKNGQYCTESHKRQLNAITEQSKRFIDELSH